MHLLDLPEIYAVFNDIVVALIPEPNCCQLGSGEIAQWVQIKVVEAFPNKVTCKYQNSRPNQNSGGPLRPGNELKHDEQLDPTE